MPSNSEIILSANTHPGDSTTETIQNEFPGDGYYGRSDGVPLSYMIIQDFNVL